MSRRTARDEAARSNLLLLIQLRWLAVAGQLATILAVKRLLKVDLPMEPMLATLGVLVLVNLVALRSRRWPVSDVTLLLTVLVDVGCLTMQLYLSGGATNPFISLYLLQVGLGAVLLEAWASWALVAITSVAFAGLAMVAPPLPLPPAIASSLSPPFVFASWFNYTLAAVLLVAFATQVSRNLRARDAGLAALQQRAAEEEQIVRMGLLASGAAHELGTPLASLSVALGDWRADPAVRASATLREEVADMQAEVKRCKEIVAGILFAAGAVTGEAPERTTLRKFIADIVATAAARDRIIVEDRTGRDRPIVADRALGQALLNLLDNAAEAEANRISVTVSLEGELTIIVRDDGRGFPPDMLDRIGAPYSSTKTKRGAGLGLFLSSNVLRTLGGSLEAENRAVGGARVTLRLPIEALALAEARA
ncbi:two-component sensor histidine kinase [Sphingomonas metalli]|uniref:histidine kinase n=1 Tax=Sphingomonas metalli TaxID=1779358 RepID=A0A916T8I9_9SPHN|nr:ATP-binding protein [Sphingomonas metalli]GGB35863.1 two-component sensor histidine kinase [Sphingomonas metalli]